MKGLLLGTNKLPGIPMMRKRQKGVYLPSSRKKARKLSKQDIAKDEGTSPLDQAPQRVEVVTDAATHGEPQAQLLEGGSISYSGGGATVSLRVNQSVAMDGWAMVRLVKGRAAVHGYSLSLGVEVLVCSNSKLAAVVAIESPRSPPPPVLHSEKIPGVPPILLPDEESFGCTLEFLSYIGGAATSAESPFDGGRDVPSQARTFRIEITGQDEIMLQEAVQRKREDGFDAESSQGSQDFEEEGMSASEDDDGKVKRGRTDMELDDSSDSESTLGREPEIKRQRKESRKALVGTVIPDSWWVAADSILHRKDIGDGVGEAQQMQRAPIVAVIGPKNAGKSTYSRFLLNFLLNSYDAVGYLDTDVGQPEFTVPGCVSLHIIREPVFGSPVLHLRDPERSFFYGDTSPKSDPEMYTRSASALFSYFQRSYGMQRPSPEDDRHGYSGMPLVINTHGWIKGIGYDVLVDILRHTSPTHVVQFIGKTQSKNLPPGKFWERPGDGGETDLLYLETAMDGLSGTPSARFKMASDHLRNSRIMAYFRQCFSKDALPYPYREDRLFAQTASALVRHSPYQVSISAVKIHHLHCCVPESESLYSVNGALVGLGVSSSTPEESNASTGLQSLCVGLGIVRGVDVEKGFLYVITPLSSDVLQEVNTLQQGRVELPVLLLQAKGHMSPYLCHHSVAIRKTGSMAMKPQKKFRRGSDIGLKAQERAERFKQFSPA